MPLIVSIHIFAVVLLALYALQQSVLLILYLKSRRTPSLPQENVASILPSVTIQLPIYNEREMAERVICAALTQDYPRDKLFVQVLDDSTDDTSTFVQRIVSKARERGASIQVIRRAHRNGYKAMALTAGLRKIGTDLVAIFDADFLPAPDFLRRVVIEHRAFDDVRVGFAQTRWGYLNRDKNAITQAQALTLDVHFVIEQQARNRNGLLMNFNGSAGIWRRECIDDAGGWRADTMTEDLDLSYRAQLRGWRGVYLPEVCSPSELPSDMLSYKRQQARWARGTLQTIRKLMPKIARSNFTLKQKIAAWFHLSGYFIHPLILTLTITTPVLLLTSLMGEGADIPFWVNVVSAMSLAPMLSMFLASLARGRSFGRFAQELPAALMLGVGTSLSTTLSMLRGLLSQEIGEWTPTPKSNVLQPSRRFANDWTMWIEFGLATYAVCAMIWIWQLGHWLAVAPMMLYVWGFGGVWLSQISQQLGNK
jgi:cellulose synthase/poly-beta-1,6-N-acetylglucosamine synthase-like glycosyltransferase